MNAFWSGCCKAKNNEEYRKVLKKRLLSVGIMITGGLVAAVLGFVILWKELLGIPEHQAGVLCGFGIGLIIGSVSLFIRIKTTLASEEKIKESRLRETDERELAVNSKALRMTAYIILVCLYLCMLIGGLFEPMITYICCLLIGIFLISYTVLKKYYQRKM